MKTRFQQQPGQPEYYQEQAPRRSNEHLFTREAGAALPFWQALITGMFLGFVFLIVAIGARMRAPWYWGLGGLCLGFGGIWFAYLVSWFGWVGQQRSGMVRQEATPQKPGKPVVHVTNVRMRTVRPGGHLAEMVASLPASMEQLKELAAGILAVPTVPFTVRAWCRERSTFTDNEQEKLRDAFLQARDPDGNELLKPISDKGTKKGFEFTAAGRQLLEKILNGEFDDD